MNAQTLESLETRVLQLENFFGINPETVVNARNDRSLSQQVTSLEEKLNGSINEGLRKNLNRRIEKYEGQKEYIDQLAKDPTFLLTLSEKGRLLSMYEDKIQANLKELDKVKGLIKYLDFPPIIELERKFQTVEPLEIEFSGQTNNFINQDDRLRETLEVYNQSIRDINLHFMYLESLVTKLENKK